jgi:hypothetical protein
LLKRGLLTALRPVRGRIVIDRFELERFVLSSSKAMKGPWHLSLIGSTGDVDMLLPWLAPPVA